MTEENEIWKQSVIPGTSHISVSNLGFVKGVRGERTPGYLSVSFYYCFDVRVGGKRVQFRVNRLVAFAFHGHAHRPWLNSVDHKDGNTENNCASNLRFYTTQLNNYNTDTSLGYYTSKYKNCKNPYVAKVIFNLKPHTESFSTAVAARQWYLDTRAGFVQQAEDVLAVKEIWWQTIISLDTRELSQDDQLCLWFVHKQLLSSV